jgi:hypothetical protein
LPAILRRTGVVSFGAPEVSEPISATSLFRFTRTDWDCMVDAKRPGTWVFSLGGAPMTRCSPRSGRPGVEWAPPASGSTRVGTHQRGGRDTASNDFTRRRSGAATCRRTATGRAMPDANLRADAAS